MGESSRVRSAADYDKNGWQQSSSVRRGLPWSLGACHLTVAGGIAGERYDERQSRPLPQQTGLLDYWEEEAEPMRRLRVRGGGHFLVTVSGTDGGTE